MARRNTAGLPSLSAADIEAEHVDQLLSGIGERQSGGKTTSKRG